MEVRAFGVVYDTIESDLLKPVSDLLGVFYHPSHSESGKGEGPVCRRSPGLPPDGAICTVADKDVRAFIAAGVNECVRRFYWYFAAFMPSDGFRGMAL